MRWFGQPVHKPAHLADTAPGRPAGEIAYVLLDDVGNRLETRPGNPDKSVAPHLA